MKKVLGVLIVMIGLFTITGCNNNSNDNSQTNSNNQNQANEQQEQVETSSYGLNDFENDVKELVADVETTEMAAEYVGAESGIKLTSGDYKIELYQFDKNSSTYQTAEESQQITMEDFGNFDAKVQNGYALIIDESFPNKTDIENLFDKLK